MELEIDLAPAQLVRWLEAELARPGPRAFAVRASREFLSEPAGGGNGLDPEDALASLVTVGLLDVAALNGSGDWCLSLRVEDPFGAHLPEDGSVPDGPEDLTLADFGAAFASEDLDASMTLTAATAADRRKAERVLARILEDRHAR
jgi:hypothetical protein